MILRPFFDSDAFVIAEWLTDIDTVYKWSAEHIGRFPVNGSDILDLYKSEKREYPYTIYMTACDDDRNPVGHLLICFPVEDHSYARFRLVIVDSSRRGQGIGRQMISMALNYSRDYLGVKQVAMAAMIDNEEAVKCYEKAGFTKIGCPIKRLINGKEFELNEFIINI